MTGLAERDQVIFGMAASLIGGDDMVNLSGGNQAPRLETFFAEGMLGDIPVTDGMPAPTVDLVVVGGTVVLVILPTGSGLMLETVALSGQSGTAGVGTGVWGFGWHEDTPFGTGCERGNGKNRSL
jgi:hypothetical protein